MQKTLYRKNDAESQNSPTSEDNVISLADLIIFDEVISIGSPVRILQVGRMVRQNHKKAYKLLMF